MPPKRKLKYAPDPEELPQPMADEEKEEVILSESSTSSVTIEVLPKAPAEKKCVKCGAPYKAILVRTPEYTGEACAKCGHRE